MISEQTNNLDEASLYKLIDDIPNDESNYIQLGLKYYSSNDPQKAKKVWEHGLIYCPNSATLLNNLAVSLLESKEFKRAKLLIERQLLIKPTAIAYNNLGLIQYRELRLEDAKKSFLKSLKLDPKFNLALSNLGFIHQELKDFDKAKSYYEKALSYDPSRIELYYKLSDLYLMLGDYLKGFELYEHRFDGLGKAQMAKALDNMQSLSIKRWEGEKTEALLVLVEQGHGDNLMMMRYVPRLKELANRVVVACDKVMNRLFSSFGVEVKNDLDSDHGCSAYAMIMSLPFIFKETTNSLDGKAYLKVKDALQINKTKPRVGICWQGSSTNIKNFTRSIDFSIFSPLLLIEDLEFISLQYGLQVKGIDNSINDCKDFYDTAVLINSLDLVISVDTSVVHLSGALGVPTLLLNRATSEWRWGVEGSDSVWYDAITILRQEQLGNWKPVIAQVVQKLHEKFKLSDKSLGKLEAYHLLRKEIDLAKIISSLR